MREDLQAIIDRARSENLAPADLQALVAAIQSGQVTLATGQQAVGIGGSANGAVVVTGDGNVLLNVTDTKAVLKILEQLNSNGANSQPSKTTFQQFPEISRFDLTQLIDKCLSELLGKRGLIGLAVPCGEKAFLKNFCDRLKHELGRSNIQIRQPLSLNPQVISVNRAVEAIKQYKKLLQTGDVICPIRVGVSDASSSISKDFWQQIKTAFQGKFKYRLIVVMVGSTDCIFPPDAIFLNPPEFEKVHAFQWIRDITQVLNWMHLSEEWMQKMIDRCLCDELGCLDVGLVYEHLDYTLSLLQRNPSLSAADFLDQLD
ncbi:MAG: hypothetical protein NW224_12305 [Leptolyngbyaceae cyanobacterium bins.302]|nr:hypothetical protein [Leptolyngbyaceae cyanobacterium bins.302]